MKGKKLYFVVFHIVICNLLFLMPRAAKGQYEEIRFPQHSDEISLFKKNKVMGETQWNLVKDKKLAYYSRAFDTAGRVVIAVDYYHRKYYVYDAKNNVTAYLDSARKDSGYVANVY